jgi:hypothetical protein
MEKKIVRWSYWLGVACVALSILMRALNLVGLAGVNSPLGGNPVGYITFFRGAVMFLLAAIAGANYAWFNRQSS